MGWGYFLKSPPIAAHFYMANLGRGVFLHYLPPPFKYIILPPPPEQITPSLFPGREHFQKLCKKCAEMRSTFKKFRAKTLHNNALPCAEKC